MDITYNINNPRALNLGYQYDHNVRTVTFTGFTPVDDANTIYLKFEGLGLYPLYQMSFPVSQSFTLKEGTFKGQLFEVKSDNTLVQNSKLFNMMVKPSIAEDTEIVQEDASLSLWFTEMSELYNEILELYNEGLLVNRENIINALGYTPANEEDIPTVPEDVSAFNNDAGYISGIDIEDVKDAIDDASTNLLDIEKYLESESDGVVFTMQDDGGVHISGTPTRGVISLVASSSHCEIGEGVYRLYISRVGGTQSNGYTVSYINKSNPYRIITASRSYVPGLNIDIYNLNLTESSYLIISKYFTVGTEVDESAYIWINEGTELHDFVKYNRINVSSFVNDSGYITGITSDDIREALGYTPADEEHVVVTIDAEDVTSALGYTPANEEDIPVVPEDISAFNNDSGYITEVTTEDVLDALGYMPADSNLLNYELVKEITVESAASVITIFEDSDGNAFGLDGATIVLNNANGIGGGTNSYLYAYDASDNLIGSSRVFFYGGSSVVSSVIEIERKGDIVKMTSVGYTSASPYAPANKSLIFSDQVSGRVAKIELYSNGQAFAANTSVALFGYKIATQSGSDDFALTKSLTLNEQAYDVVITTDNDNNALDLKEFAVTIENTNGIGGGTNGYIYAYDAHDGLIGSQVFFAGGASITNAVVEFEVKGSILEMNSIGWNTGTAYSPINKSLIGVLGDDRKIAKIEISGNGFQINSGTVINVYGV